MRSFLPVLAAFVSLSPLLFAQSCGEDPKDHESEESPYHLAMKENKHLFTLYQNAAYQGWEPDKAKDTLEKLADNADKIKSLERPDTVTETNRAQYDGFLKAFQKNIKDLQAQLKSSGTAAEFRNKAEPIQLKASCSNCHNVFQKKDDH